MKNVSHHVISGIDRKKRSKETDQIQNQLLGGTPLLNFKTKRQDQVMKSRSPM